MRSNGRVLFWELLLSEAKVLYGEVQLGCGLGMLCGGISAVMEKWRDVPQSFGFVK